MFIEAKAFYDKVSRLTQCLLNGKNKELSLGLSDLTVDGIFGNNTKKMVRKFQEKTGGLGNDGVVGKNTFLKLILNLKRNRNLLQ